MLALPAEEVLYSDPGKTQVVTEKFVKFSVNDSRYINSYAVIGLIFELEDFKKIIASRES